MFQNQLIEYYAVAAYDCDNRCVGVSAFYTNEEAANEHKKWLLAHTDDPYEIIVEHRQFRIKTGFERPEYSTE